MNDYHEMDVFNEKLQQYIETLDIKKRNKYTIKQNMYMDILSVLKGEKTIESSKFKYWVKNTFRIVHIGATELVYVIKNNLPLTIHENIFYRISDCHVAVGHSGRDKTWAEVNTLNLKSV
jgi:hypothetical protein